MSDLRVGLVTTWGTSCGIATYSEELAEELRKEVAYLRVFSEAGPGTITRRDQHDERVPSEPAWSRFQPSGNAALIAGGIAQYQLNVLHVQHEFGLWPNDAALAETLRAARGAGAATVVTLHTVFPAGSYLRAGTWQLLARAADVVIVHSLQAGAALLAAGAPRVEVIPHGVAPRTRGDRDAGLEWFGVPPSARDKYAWGLVFGFQAPGKNIINTLRSYAMGRAIGQIKRCGLLIAGEVKDELYGMRLNGAAMEGGYITTLFKRDGFVDSRTRDNVFAAADFGVLNHLGSQPAILSASGQVHVAASYGLPLAYADAPIYDAARSFGVPFQVDWEQPEAPSLSCANAIAALAGTPGLRATLSARAQETAAALRWARVAETTAAVYARSKCPR